MLFVENVPLPRRDTDTAEAETGSGCDHSDGPWHRSRHWHARNRFGTLA